MNSNYKVIDVFIPVYNAEKYLNKCLQSIVNQTIFDKLNVVVIDDGSTDHSSDIIDEYALKYSNIRAYKQENKGLPFARQAGLLQFLENSERRGKYFYTADSDDFLHPKMLESLLRVAETNNSDFTYCDYSFYPHKIATKAKWYKPYKGIVDWQLIERNTQPWNKLIRWDLSDSVKLQDIWPIYGDSVYVDLIVHAKKIVSIDDNLYYYRVGHESMSGSYKGRLNFYLHVAEIAKQQIDFVTDLDNSELTTYFHYRYIYALLQVCFIAVLDNNRVVYQDTCKELNKLNYIENKYTKIILRNNFGILKAFILGQVVPRSYFLTKLVCRVALGE